MFKSWIEDHGGIIAIIARSFARTPPDMEDVRQEMMLQLWVTASVFSGHTGLHMDIWVLPPFPKLSSTRPPACRLYFGIAPRTTDGVRISGRMIGWS
jgi:hypothetical protein